MAQARSPLVLALGFALLMGCFAIPENEEAPVELQCALAGSETSWETTSR